jgi:hypothetical protein
LNSSEQHPEKSLQGFNEISEKNEKNEKNETFHENRKINSKKKIEFKDDNDDTKDEKYAENSRNHAISHKNNDNDRINQDLSKHHQDLIDEKMKNIPVDFKMKKTKSTMSMDGDFEREFSPELNREMKPKRWTYLRICIYNAMYLYTYMDMYTCISIFTLYAYVIVSKNTVIYIFNYM